MINKAVKRKQNKTVFISLRLTPNLKAALKDYSRELNIPIAELLRDGAVTLAEQLLSKAA